MDLEALRTAHPGWQIWESRLCGIPSGNFYATPGCGCPRWYGMTLSADDPGELGDLIGAQEDFWSGLLISPPAGHLYDLADS